jgi:hypothetical protein
VTTTPIRKRDLTSFPRKVASTVYDLVNNHGVTYRQPDGSHLLLYNGDRTTRPFKLAASRPEEQQMNYLVPWIEKNVPAYFETTDLSVLEGMVTPPVTPPADPPAREWVSWESGALEGHVSSHLYWDREVNPAIIRCTEDDYTTDTKRGAHLHESMHTGTAVARSLRAAQTRAELRAVRDLEAEQEATLVSEAVAVIAKHYGITGDSDRVAELEAENHTLKAQVDELSAKLALIREASGL